MRQLGVSMVAVFAVTSAALVATTSASAATAAETGTTSSSAATEYVVLQDANSGTDAAQAAVEKAGGTVVSTNDALGYVVARSTDSGFEAEVNADSSVIGAAANRVIGQAPQDQQASQFQIEQLREAGSATEHTGKAATSEPLADLQWDMQMIDATAKGSYAKQSGNKKVLVGIIDTGVDGSHPDIAPNFSTKLSRNFVTDMTDIDGECEVASCKDPADEDDNGHGTHVASTIGSPVNGIGIAGVAPNVTLVNIRAGQDSGYFFLEPTLEALTYAGDIGVDVVNMSYYVDPWLYNCVANPADSAAEQQEQQVIRTATQRALNYARNKGVLPVSAEGNEATDLNNPTTDDTSPDYPADAAKEREVDNSCINVPAENKGVLTVSSVGPSTRKAYYSNYGTEETDVAAPGGDAYDTAENTLDYSGLVLAAYPEALAIESGDVDADGEPTTSAVVKSCKGSTCAYYQYLQGTSMAAPHAVGVAALVVSEFGKKTGSGFGLDPDKTEAKVLKSATETACPSPRTYTYTIVRSSGTSTLQATCEGKKSDNGFYGQGIVNAKAAVSGKL